MKNNLRILHIGESIKGGAGTHLNELIPLQKTAYADGAILVLVPAEHVSQLPDVDAHCIKTFHRSDRLRGLPFLISALIKLLVTQRLDILHAHSTLAGFIARIVAPVFGTTVIYTPHGWAMDRQQSGVKKRSIAWLERIFSHLCARIIAVSDAERRSGISSGIAAAKLVTIYNGIKRQAPAVGPASWNDIRLKLLFVGRLDLQKGVDILLNAIESLEDKIVVRIVGDSVVGDGLLDVSAYPHVQALGWLSLKDVTAQIAACDAVVMPSRWEGLPIVALEAMRAGKPLIAASVGGIPELVIDGETGRLFPSENSAAMHEILSTVSIEELHRMGLAGRALFLEKFTSDKMSAATIAIYAECLNKGKMKT